VAAGLPWGGFEKETRGENVSEMLLVLQIESIPGLWHFKIHFGKDIN
jgi:hypothetical protein